MNGDDGHAPAMNGEKGHTPAMNGSVEVCVLGPLEVRREATPCPVGSRLQRRLLASLTMAAGATLSTELLIDRLWGEAAPPAARNSLQSHVARLRSLLGEGLVLTRPPGYALDATRVSIDAIAFERAVIGARDVLRHDPVGATRSLNCALGTWRGAAYAEFADDLAQAEAVRLEQLRVDARRTLAEAQLRSGEAPAAVDTLLRLVGDEPLREDVVVTAAGGLHAVGRTTEALAVVRRYRTRLADELGLDPSGAVAGLEQRLLRGEPLAEWSAVTAHATAGVAGSDRPFRAEVAGAADVRAAPTPPPAVTTAVLGRDEDLVRIEQALGSCRLVTLVGPGGVGKTRVATELARARLRSGQTPVAWVDLANVMSPSDVPPVIVEALGAVVPDQPDPPVAASALARFPGTVVFDNCEHVLEVTAGVVGRALAKAGGHQLRVVATSRERLDVADEQVVALAPLPVPDPALATDTDPAVRLFQQRLTAGGGPPVTAEQAARVAAAVDGMPLGLELAAARATTLPVDELVVRMARHLDVLSGSARRHGRRHRTLSRVIAWSHDLLDERAQAVFRRLAVFASSFRLADAEQVAAGDDLRGDDVVDAVARLVETSMLARVGAGRYRLLAPLRRFALDRLETSSDASTTPERHRAWVLALAARGDAELTGPDETTAIAELEAALPDLRAVHGRAAACGDLDTVARLAAELYRFAYVQARGDLLAWGSRVLTDDAFDASRDAHVRAIAASVPAETWRNAAGEARRRAQLYAARVTDASLEPWTRITLAETLADLQLQSGELEAAAASYAHGAALAERIGHDGLTSWMLSGLSLARSFQDERRDAERIARRAIELAAAPLVPTAASLAAYALGEAIADEDPDGALAAFAAALRHAAEVRARFLEGIALTADVALRGRHGDPGEALSRYRAALGLWRDAGADGMALPTLRNLVVLLTRTQAPEDAIVLEAALARLATRASYGEEADRLRGAVRIARASVSPEDGARARRVGRGLTELADVVVFGLASIARVQAR
jgi:predicted ATPase/DNA-binding SARP family transcriptional activator